jgi:two-component system OmpR family response regulator
MTSALYKVLVVDDEADVGELLAYGLSTAGFEVTVTPTAKSALDATERWAPDIILLDVMLPDIDGFTLLPKLRSISGSPVIFLTARSRGGDRERGLRLGAADYVTKPFDMDHLIARLRSALTSA